MKSSELEGSLASYSEAASRFLRDRSLAKELNPPGFRLFNSVRIGMALILATIGFSELGAFSGAEKIFPQNNSASVVISDFTELNPKIMDKKVIARYLGNPLLQTPS
jgi:hypothetical protein